MDLNKTYNNENALADQQDKLSSVSLRDDFLNWLLKSNFRVYSPDVLVNCLDKISEYSLRKRICRVDIWKLDKYYLFQPVYDEITGKKLFRLINGRIYNVFLTAGPLYLKFLTVKDKVKIKISLNDLPDLENVPQSIPDSTASLVTTMEQYIEVNNSSSELPNAKENIIPFPQDTNTTTIKEKPFNEALIVDFTHPELCSQTRPVNCIIKSREIILEKQNWAQLLGAITERFIEDNNPYLNMLERIPIYGSKPFFLQRKTDVGYCCKLSNGKWIYTNYNPQTIVTIIGNLCQHCGINLCDVIINYLPKSIVDTTIPTVIKEFEFTKTIIDIMSTHFRNGFKIDSAIELSRFRIFSAEELGYDIPIDDVELVRSIINCGTLYKGKVYVIAPETIARIQKELSTALCNGANILFFQEFYNKHEEWLFPASVVSADLLKYLIRNLYPTYNHRNKYFMRHVDKYSESARIESELVRVWGDDVLKSYSWFAEQLPYVPLNKIKQVLAYSSNFIWNSESTYTHLSKVDITEEERVKIAEFVAKYCRTNGYASLSGIPLCEIQERNYELTVSTIQNAIFEIVLADKYDKHGKIVYRKGNSLDALALIKDYCRTQNRCSIEDLINFQHELTGELQRWVPMEAGYSVMVRADKDYFIADKYVHFDIAQIDSALEHFITGEYLPLKNITTFSAFPNCGQAWNLFLLESYCRRFSDSFRFEALVVNSRNAGVIVRKSIRLSYVQIMADALAKSRIPLEKTAIEEFLCINGYIGKRSYSKTDELIEQAKALRKRSH